MGFFGRLFGPRKPPPWARAGFGEDGAKFEDFLEVVGDVLDAKGVIVSYDAIRSGSLVLRTKKGGQREVSLEEAATACGRVDHIEWRAIVESAIGGKHPPREPARTGSKAWVIGAAPWGGVLFECGAQEMLLVLMPTIDKPAVPTLPPGLVRAIIVCNAGDQGNLAATSIARSAGLSHVYAVDAARPIDRGGGPTGIAVKPLGKLEIGPLKIEPQGTAVFGRWNNGISFVAGDAVLFWQLGELVPTYFVGKLVHDGRDHDKMIDALISMQRAIIVANVPGNDARTIAKLFSTLGITAEIVNEPPPSRRTQVLAHMMAGELDKAAALAREAIAADDNAVDMHHQLGMIALMRGDEAAADIELAKIDTPQALTSRAIIAAKRGNLVAAKEQISRAVEQLPGDEIAKQAASAIDAMTNDLGAGWQLVHRFPEHAQLLLEAVKPMIDQGNYAAAISLLRRAREWDNRSVTIATELGYSLSQTDKDDEAIALYSDMIARGGEGLLLHYNRGNCHIRKQRFADAAADFRACVALKSDWHEARVNLVSALFANGDKAGSRGELDQLKVLGGNPDHIRGLEQMLAGTL